MSDEFKFSGGTDENDGFSFGSILAEVKGSAFINGDKKTPHDVLQEKADRILREAEEQYEPKTIADATARTSAGGFDINDLHNELNQSDNVRAGSVPSLSAEYDVNQAVDSSIFEPDFDETDELPIILTPIADDERVQRLDDSVSLFGTTMDTVPSIPMKSPPSDVDNSEDSVFPINIEQSSTKVNSSQELQEEPAHNDNPIILFDQFREDSYKERDMDSLQNQETRVFQETNLFNDEHFHDEELQMKPKWSFANLFNRGAKTHTHEHNMDSSMSMFENQNEQVLTEEDLPVEPPLKNAVRKFARACNSISIRVIPASVITIFMLVVTFAFEAGLILPFGIGHNMNIAASILTICLLIVMMLCSDVLVRGFDFLKKGEPNAETLILFSCAFSVLSPIFIMIFTMASDLELLHLPLPFCVVSALSITFAAHAEKYNLRAITDSLKTAIGSNEPYGVQAEYNEDIDKTILKKVYNRTDGFYNNLMQPDISEVTYRVATPILLVASLLLTILIIIFRDGMFIYTLHILSALLAAAAPFSALLAFSIPFITMVKSTRKSGVALAGWGGADDIHYTDGVCVTDDDLFPPGMLKLSGVKVYDGASPEHSIRYTASLIMSSGSGLTGLFTEVLKQQGLSSIEVDDFEYHESGIAGTIRGQKVTTGSAAFMNLHHVRVPDDTNMKNAVYTAVDNRLVAMFAVDYKPLPSVQSALISMLKWRIDLYFAMRDFNVTPAMVGQKFKVPFDSFVFIPAKNSYSISDLHSEKPGRMSAILLREGLNPFAEAITSGRLLRAAAFFASILSIVSAGLGVLIMFYICWTGALQSASPGNLVIFMLCMLATVLIVCGYVRLKK